MESPTAGGECKSIVNTSTKYTGGLQGVPGWLTCVNDEIPAESQFDTIKALYGDWTNFSPSLRVRHFSRSADQLSTTSVAVRSCGR